VPAGFLLGELQQSASDAEALRLRGDGDVLQQQVVLGGFENEQADDAVAVLGDPGVADSTAWP
jgi:hypothetical protein